MKEREIRIINSAKYILRHNSTIRATANVFGISKSTLHYDLSYRLKKIDLRLYEKVKKLLDYNFSQKHIRGGQATRELYKKCNKRKKWPLIMVFFLLGIN